MNQSSCYVTNSPCSEKVYLVLDIAPIALAWGACLLLWLILTFLYCCLWLSNTFCQTATSIDLESSPVCESKCKDCHCESCGRLKCEDDPVRCKCKSCVYDNGKFKECHQMVPICKECGYTPPESTQTEQSKKKKCAIFLFSLGNTIAHLLLGGKLGLVREFPRKRY